MKRTIVFTLFMAFFAGAALFAQQEMMFGADMDAKGSITYDKMLELMEEKGGLEDIKVRGMVGEVCQMKGCWVTMVSEKDDDAESMFIKFKDYAFFVPKDIGGSTVVIRGDAYYEETSVEDLRHMAEDAGKSKEEIMAITKPKEELKFYAKGVLIVERAPGN